MAPFTADSDDGDLSRNPAYGRIDGQSQLDNVAGFPSLDFDNNQHNSTFTNNHAPLPSLPGMPMQQQYTLENISPELLHLFRGTSQNPPPLPYAQQVGHQYQGNPASYRATPDSKSGKKAKTKAKKKKTPPVDEPIPQARHPSEQQLFQSVHALRHSTHHNINNMALTRQQQEAADAAKLANASGNDKVTLELLGKTTANVSKADLLKALADQKKLLDQNMTEKEELEAQVGSFATLRAGTSRKRKKGEDKFTPSEQKQYDEMEKLFRQHIYPKVKFVQDIEDSELVAQTLYPLVFHDREEVQSDLHKEAWLNTWLHEIASLFTGVRNYVQSRLKSNLLDFYQEHEVWPKFSWLKEAAMHSLDFDLPAEPGDDDATVDENALRAMRREQELKRKFIVLYATEMLSTYLCNLPDIIYFWPLD